MKWGERRKNPCQKPPRVFRDVLLFYFDFLSGKSEVAWFGSLVVEINISEIPSMLPTCNLALVKFQ